MSYRYIILKFYRYNFIFCFFQKFLTLKIFDLDWCSHNMTHRF